MSRRDSVSQPSARWPRWWKFTVVAIATLVLCSCKSLRHQVPNGEPLPAMHQAAPLGAMPAGMMPSGAAPMAVAQGPLPVPDVQYVPGPWQPPGMVGPWPKDEYLCDGGDHRLPARVGPDWKIYGLEQEDTIAHFDTLDGRTVVEPSNKVCLYAPRFAAVRSVSDVSTNDHVIAPIPMDQPVELAALGDTQGATSHLQRFGAQAQIGSKQASTYRMRMANDLISSELKPTGFDDRFQPFEDLSIVRFGLLKHADAARLTIAKNAAKTWNSDLTVLALVDGRTPGEVAGDKQAEVTLTFDTPKGQAKLRVVKLASTMTALPGDVIDFTIRFDNVGTQLIGNVTIVDNLTTRLEYVPESAECSLPAQFHTEPNDGDSLVIRCEVNDPLPPGQGGIVRFKCKVR